jgi:hypothetical protein
MTVTVDNAPLMRYHEIMNQTQQNLLNTILQAKVANQEMFTAYDITMAMRASGVNIYHSEVRDEVHNFYTSGNMTNYNRKSQLVAGGVFAYVFYHCQSDPSTYVSKNPVATPMTSNSTPVASVKTAVTLTPIKPTGTRNTDPSSLTIDAWQRLRVPASITRQIGLKPYDYADVKFDSKNGIIEIGRTGCVPGAIQSNTVDQYGNIRFGLKQQRINATSFKTIPMPSKGLVQIIAD